MKTFCSPSLLTFPSNLSVAAENELLTFQGVALVSFLNQYFLFPYLQLAREVLDVAAMMVKAGVTTEEIDHAVHLVRLFYCSSGVFK